MDERQLLALGRNSDGTPVVCFIFFQETSCKGLYHFLEGQSSGWEIGFSAIATSGHPVTNSTEAAVPQCAMCSSPGLGYEGHQHPSGLVPCEVWDAIAFQLRLLRRPWIPVSLWLVLLDIWPQLYLLFGHGPQCQFSILGWILHALESAM